MFTYITDTKELFALVESDEIDPRYTHIRHREKVSGYQIYRIDLDADELKFDNGMGQQIPVFEYTH